MALRVVNFHNRLDYALATGHILSGLKQANWEANEEDYKPDGADRWKPHEGSWWYDYKPDVENLQEMGQLFQPNDTPPPYGRLIRNVTDSYEIKAFIARPRSKAVGAVDRRLGNLPDLPITLNESLFRYNLREQDYDHSGQFNRNIQQVFRLYQRIFDIVNQ